MKLSINNKIINKNDNKVSQSKGFKAVDISPAELAQAISLGYAFSYQFKDDYRKADNFICSDIIAADIDDGVTLDEALADEFIINNACLIYTSASHTPENHRFRIVFQLAYTITDKEKLRIVQRGLVRKYAADKAATDPARQFYGSQGCEFHIFENILSEDALSSLLELGNEPINFSDRHDNVTGKAGFRSSVVMDENFEVKDQRGNWIKLSDTERSTRIYCPFHHDKSPSAFTVVSKSNVKGIHCSTCQVTFWPKDKAPKPYDFLVFDKLVKKEASDFVPSSIFDESGFLEYEIKDPNVLVNERYLPKIEKHTGLTLIKSPKGTGKTDYLKHLVAEYKKNKVSVLLVGHRISLLRALSASLGLTCYLDLNDSSVFASLKVTKHFAISVDSMAKMLKPNINKFDVVLIDESEQVFSHLISDTIEVERRRKCYLLLQHYIHVAKTVVALDADLNHITLHAIQRFGSKNPFSDRRLVLNEYKSPQQVIEIYPSQSQLIADIFKSVENGQRIFICSNSKKTIDALVLAIYEKHGADFPLFWVTSENSGKDEVNDFITNIKEEILKYQVVLVSPAVGTGIDITFPDNVSNVDGVYGLFEARVNTHFDIDQQLSRVRHPNFVRVWISPEIFNFETEVEPIKQELAESGVIPDILTGYANSGMPEFNWNDPYLTLYSTILSAQRASKNKLLKNFIDLKTYNGWSVVEIPKDKDDISEGADIHKQGKALRRAEYIRKILNANVIDQDAVDELKRKTDKGKTLTTDEKNSVERFWLGKFYLEDVSVELIEMDDEGKYRKQILMMEALLGTNTKSQDDAEIKAKVKLLRELFKATGVYTAANNFDVTATITSYSLKNFVTLCKTRKVKIERVLGSTLRKDLYNKPLSQLADYLKLCGLKTVLVRIFEDDNDQKIYEYRLEPQSLENILNIVEQRKERYNPQK